MADHERLQVLLVDDEPAANVLLRTLLKRHPDVLVVGEAEGGREAIAAIGELVPDLVFLDVQMPMVDGFAVVRAVGPGRMPGVVFVTAHDEFAVRAFEVSAVDYLLKPVSPARLDQALARARGQAAHTNALQLAARLRALLSDVGGSGAPHDGGPGVPGRLLVRSGSKDVVVSAADVDWLEADDNRVVVHCREGRYETRGTLADVAARLDARHFMKIHRSVVVQTLRVREVLRNAWGGMHLVLEDGTKLPVSRRQRAEVRARLGGRHASG